MGSTQDKYYEKLVTELAKKYEQEKRLQSVGAKEPWLLCYHEIGLLIRDIEQQGHELPEILQSLSRHLPKAFPYTAPYRFSRENLFRMKKFASSPALSPDLARWEAVRQPHWHGPLKTERMSSGRSIRNQFDRGLAGNGAWVCPGKQTSHRRRQKI